MCLVNLVQSAEMFFICTLNASYIIFVTFCRKTILRDVKFLDSLVLKPNPNQFSFSAHPTRKVRKSAHVSITTTYLAHTWDMKVSAHGFWTWQGTLSSEVSTLEPRSEAQSGLMLTMLSNHWGTSKIPTNIKCRCLFKFKTLPSIHPVT